MIEIAAGIVDKAESVEEVCAFTADAVREMLASGRVRNRVTLIALQWFLLDHKTLRTGVLPEAAKTP